MKQKKIFVNPARVKAAEQFICQQLDYNLCYSKLFFNKISNREFLGGIFLFIA